MAADSPTPGTETWVSPFPPFGTTPPPCTACGYQHNPLAWCKANVCADCGLGQHAGPDHYDGCPAAPSPVDTTEPPAETQQDDDHEPYADAYEWEPVAARPSADTETLRRVREAADLLTRDADESSDVIARLAYRDAANRIRAALDAR